MRTSSAARGNKRPAPAVVELRSRKAGDPGSLATGSAVRLRFLVGRSRLSNNAGSPPCAQRMPLRVNRDHTRGSAIGHDDTATKSQVGRGRGASGWGDAALGHAYYNRGSSPQAPTGMSFMVQMVTNYSKRIQKTTCVHLPATPRQTATASSSSGSWPAAFTCRARRSRSVRCPFAASQPAACPARHARSKRLYAERLYFSLFTPREHYLKTRKTRGSGGASKLLQLRNHIKQCTPSQLSR